ncbi:MAG: iron-containing alcohol dehydrogenase [Clostridia bacterium]|nr:iron-containing alcohol dehydrogenase [Clostridia bacterium]
MKDFIYNTPTKVYFGLDTEKKVGEIIKEFRHKRVMLQYGKSSIKKSGLYDVVINSLKENGIEFVEMGGVEPNPKIEFVRDAVKLAKAEKVDLILAVGGGSVLDSCKYTALGAKSDFDPWDFAIGKAKPVDALKVGCVLTMSAAGSEMSNSAVITNLAVNMKKGCTTEFNRCEFAICNPALTFTVGKYQTACGIVDIMTHTMERYFTTEPEVELTDRIAESILKSVVIAGEKVIENPCDYDARAEIMWASSLSHNGLTACGRFNYLAVHQLEHALSGEFDFIAHGAGLAVLEPAWMRYQYKANPKRFAQFARRVLDVVCEDDIKASEQGIEKLTEFFAKIGMPTKLREFGIPETSMARLAELCTYGKTRVIEGYIPLDYDNVKEIFDSCY